MINVTDSVFKHLSPAETDRLDQDKTTLEFQRGTTIYSEDSRITGCYCVESGIVKIYKTGIDGREQIIRFAKTGDLIGFRSVISEELACTSAEVIQDAVLCFIPGKTLLELIRSNGDFSIELMQVTCRELKEANSYITDIAQKTVRERLAEILIHLKEEFGTSSEGILLISLTREELANIVGTATESVIRFLSEFRQEELIDLQGRKIKICNESGLVRLSNVYGE